MARSARRPGSQPHAGGNILDRIDDDTQVIPGHGRRSDQSELRAYHDMLRAVRDRVRAMVEEGRSLDEVLAAEGSAAYDAEYGQGFIAPERFVTSIYRSLTTEKFPRRPVRGGLTRQESPGFSRGSVNAPARTAPSSAC